MTTRPPLNTGRRIREDGMGPDPKFLGLLDQKQLTRLQAPYGGQAWVATTHGDVKTVLSDPRFERVQNESSDTPRSHQHPRAGRSLSTLMGEEHKRIRRLISGAFSAKRVANLEPYVTEECDRLIRALRKQHRFDIVSQFAFPLPVAVLCKLFGLPESDREKLRDWSRILISGAAHTPTEMNAAHQDMRAYFRGELASRRMHPQNDLLSSMAANAHRDITEDDLLELCMVVLASGYETTARQLSSSLLVLLKDPTAWAQICASSNILTSAVEELLRFVQLGKGLGRARRAVEDVPLSSGVVKAGEYVFIGGGADNFDPSVFADPDSLILDRSPNPHLQFGHGPHACAGAALARMELRIALRQLSLALPELKLHEFELDQREGLLMRGPKLMICSS